MRKKKKRVLGVVLFFVILAVAFVVACLIINKAEAAPPITDEELQQLVDDTFSNMVSDNVSDVVKYIENNSSITVNSVEEIDSQQKKLICTIRSVDAYDIVKSNLSSILSMDLTNPVTKQTYTSSRILPMVSELLIDYFDAAKKTVYTGVEVYVYDSNGKWVVYTPDDLVGKYYGNCDKIFELADSIDIIMSLDGSGTAVPETLKTGIKKCFGENTLTYDSSVPVIGGTISQAVSDFKDDFYLNFIKNANWHYLTDGLVTTLEITGVSVVIGIVFGFILALIRVTYDRTGKLWILNGIANAYLTVVRGTPVMVQLMIIYFVISMPLGINKMLAAFMCFGLNSAAYVAEIIRGGIMGLDAGQNEAGRSLGLSYGQTMWSIIMPQSFKSVLPALFNEVIALLKETSVAAYIGINDLARGGDIIRGITYSAFMPLVAVALIYLVIVMVLSKLVSILERRLRKSDRHS